MRGVKSFANEDETLNELHQQYLRCKTVLGRTEVRIKIKNRLAYLESIEKKLTNETSKEKEKPVKWIDGVWIFFWRF